MKISLIQVPYHMGHEQEGTGKAPGEYLRGGAESKLRARGFDVEVETVSVPGAKQRALSTVNPATTEDELAAIAAVDGQLAGLVKSARGRGCLPIVLAGDCNSCLGTLAGVGTAETGIIWFDAHGDFNTPQTTPSGFLEGMPLAVATGRCHRELWERIGNRVPVADSRTLLVGVRETDPGEQQSLEHSQVQVLSAAEIKRDGLAASLAPRMDKLRSLVSAVYLHLDLDVLDPSESPGHDFPAPGGLSHDELELALRMVRDHFTIQAAALTAYNPERDEQEKSLRAGLHFLQLIAESAAASEYSRTR